MIEIKRIQQQPDVAQAIYEVMTDVYPVSPWQMFLNLLHKGSNFSDKGYLTSTFDFF